jgi:hypothetical protein
VVRSAMFDNLGKGLEKAWTLLKKDGRLTVENLKVGHAPHGLATCPEIPPPGCSHQTLEGRHSTTLRRKEKPRLSPPLHSCARTWLSCSGGCSVVHQSL